jgi:hypothetical protein
MMELGFRLVYLISYLCSVLDICASSELCSVAMGYCPPGREHGPIEAVFSLACWKEPDF